jgi:alkylhydroperoxidase family enzyme
LRAVLGLLEKMTLSHESFGHHEVLAVFTTGVSKEAIAEAMEVALLFNVYDRLADTMGGHVPDKTSGYYNVSAKRLLKDGYA